MLCKTQPFLLFPAFCIENSETKGVLGTALLGYLELRTQFGLEQKDANPTLCKQLYHISLSLQEHKADRIIQSKEF